jgi:hypothetical protein
MLGNISLFGFHIAAGTSQHDCYPIVAVAILPRMNLDNFVMMLMSRTFHLPTTPFSIAKPATHQERAFSSHKICNNYPRPSEVV